MSPTKDDVRAVSAPLFQSVLLVALTVADPTLITKQFVDSVQMSMDRNLLRGVTVGIIGFLKGSRGARY